MCHCKFISYDKSTTLVGNIDNGGRYARAGEGGLWEIPVLSAQYCYEPKTGLKIKSLKNNG